MRECKGICDKKKQDKSSLKLSIIIPAYNEEMNILPTLDELLKELRQESIPFEIIVVNDNCQDK